ncbi:MAG: rhomboid family intramembrane serine protease [Prevotellaceae bacterium]|jgi:membrane associated rhomboid family serine protease|nr:rhomboid family intramembrane serine protease [Prevotellaceae bacterium]
MKPIFILIFILVFIFFENELGYTGIFPLWKHLAFHFQHSNFLHLLINSVCFCFVFKSLRVFVRSRTIILVSLTAATAASFFCCYDIPVVGASAMIYAMIGMLIIIFWRKGYFRQKAFFKNFALWLCCITLSLTISFFKTNSATMLHLISLFSGGIIYFLLCLLFTKKKNRISQ